MDEPSSAKRPSVLTIDRAAFLLLRVKRAFKKKRQQRKEKQAASAAAAAAEALGGGGGRRAPPPLLRSRTLPAIVVPGLSILHAQIDPQRSNDLTQSQLLCRGVSAHKVSGLRPHAPRISFTGKDEADTHELRRKSASSRLGSSPRSSNASEERADGLVLRVPTPRGSVSSTSSSTSSRLTRLLTQSVRSTPADSSVDAPRRLSWERRESFGQLPRSASIDSVVEAAICARHSEPQPVITLQLPARADRALSLVSPAVGRRTKSQRGQAVTAKLPIPHSDAYVKIPVTLGETSETTHETDSDVKNKFYEMKVYEPEQTESVSDEPPSYWEVMNEENDKVLGFDFAKTETENGSSNFEKAYYKK